ncbi:MAG: sulfotransferase [Wenzhouxiangella sp.]|nr:sulfotransferase [Wenzhouxiangella sp.]
MSADHHQAPVAEARRLFAEGKPAPAESLLRERMQQSPACKAALRDFLVAEQRIPEAVELIRGSTEAVDRALAAHVAGDFAAAAEACRQALANDPDDAAALLYLARAVHNLGDQKAALDALRHAVELRPGFAEAWYARAHARRASGDLEGAVHDYEKALALSPGLRQARLNLGITRFNMDDAHGALACFEDLLARRPDDIEALVHSGLTLQLAGDLAAARSRLEKAVNAHPDHPLGHRYLAAVCSEEGDDQAAVEHLEKALDLAPDDADLYAELAGIHELSNRLDDMAGVVERGLELAPQHPQLVIESARLERRRGNPQAALQQLQRIDPNGLPPRAAQQFFHEAALSLDRIGEADQAMQTIAVANRIKAGEPRAAGIDRTAAFERIERIGQWAAGASAWQEGPDGWAGEDVCFIIGFPRSGTTLLDTMLDAHEQAVSIEEKPTLEPVIDQVAESHGYPEGIDRLTAGELASLREAYRANLARFLPRDHGARIVIDKMPLRILDAAFIRRLLPRARFILALRHPCDLVVSNYMQLFDATETLIHTTTLEGTVRLYDAVMTAWRSIEPLVDGGVARLRYEDLVADPQAELRRMCEFLGLPWDPSLVETRKRIENRGRIRTPSYQQVSEDVYQRSAGRWRRYRRHLEPFMPTLEKHAAALGYSTE